MASQLNPYLNFNGNARQALEFYASVFGGDLTLNTFADFGAQGSPDAGVELQRLPRVAVEIEVWVQP